MKCTFPLWALQHPDSNLTWKDDICFWFYLLWLLWRFNAHKFWIKQIWTNVTTTASTLSVVLFSSAEHCPRSHLRVPLRTITFFKSFLAIIVFPQLKKKNKTQTRFSSDFITIDLHKKNAKISLTLQNEPFRMGSIMRNIFRGSLRGI